MRARRGARLGVALGGTLAVALSGCALDAPQATPSDAAVTGASTASSLPTTASPSASPAATPSSASAAPPAPASASPATSPSGTATPSGTPSAPAAAPTSTAIPPASGIGQVVSTTPRGTQPATPALQAAAGRGEPVDCATYMCVALTFDDGPGTQNAQLLQTLRAQDVPATFFFYGLWVRKYPQSVAATAQTSGMEVANHTVDHAQLSRIPLPNATWQITQNHADLVAAGAPHVAWMRPPYGLVNQAVATAAAQVGEATVTWNVDSQDYRDKNTASVTQRILAGARPGAVVLMHEIHPTSVAAVPGVVAGLKERGYLLVNLTQMLGEPRPGALYELRDPALIVR